MDYLTNDPKTEEIMVWRNDSMNYSFGGMKSIQGCISQLNICISPQNFKNVTYINIDFQIILKN